MINNFKIISAGKVMSAGKVTMSAGKVTMSAGKSYHVCWKSYRVCWKSYHVCWKVIMSTGKLPCLLERFRYIRYFSVTNADHSKK
jgi:hypothetical protein